MTICVMSYPVRWIKIFRLNYRYHNYPRPNKIEVPYSILLCPYTYIKFFMPTSNDNSLAISLCPTTYHTIFNQ